MQPVANQHYDQAQAGDPDDSPGHTRFYEMCPLVDRAAVELTVCGVPVFGLYQGNPSQLHTDSSCAIARILVMGCT